MEELTETLLDNVLLILGMYLDYPSAIKLEQSEGEDTKGKYFKIYVHVDSRDMGRIIGHNGENADALRRIVNLVGRKNIKTIPVHLQIVSGKWIKEHQHYEKITNQNGKK